MRRTLLRFAVAAALVAGTSPVASAQEQSREFESFFVPGWTFTPSVSFGGVWDSNVAVAANQAEGRRTDRDRLFLFEPQGQLEFRDNRTEFTAGYRGHLRRYIEVDELNGFDQRAFVSLQRRASKRVTLSINNDFADVPSTDELLLNGIPYSRTGSRSNRLGASMDARLTKYDDVGVRYENTWVSFDSEATFLSGGLMHGVSVDYGRRLSQRTTLGAEYRVRRANINDDARIMWFQDVGGVVKHLLGPHLAVELAGGYSTLDDPALASNEGGLYFRGELTSEMARSTLGLHYERSYAPSFGFGGSSQSQALVGFIHMPFSRNRLYLQSSAGWRRTNPLLALQELELDSFHVDNTLGYGAARWFRVELFHVYTRQDSRITGGEINRQRAGAQIVFSQPMRIR